jgi:hypothetical protein
MDWINRRAIPDSLGLHKNRSNSANPTLLRPVKIQKKRMFILLIIAVYTAKKLSIKRFIQWIAFPYFIKITICLALP